MKRLPLAALALAVVLATLTGCHGPQRMTRALDEWANNGYEQSPWLFGNFLSHVLLAGASVLTWTVDSVTNVYYFWVDDAAPFGDGKGTPYPFQAKTPEKR
jgi:hypothetical protein